MRIVLASASPRRRELIKKITEDYETVPAKIDEAEIERSVISCADTADQTVIGEMVVLELAREKAVSTFMVLGEPQDALVIGADTVVCLKDEILGKPKDREDAVRMLRAQSLEPQTVITGVAIVCKDEVASFSEKTLVFFHPLDEEQEKRIQEYCDTDEPYDKAGGYGIQLGGASLVDHYEGDFDNVVGFPTERIRIEVERIEHLYR
ncbi:MAG: septum formation protein Maf [Firmicutes bacterium]|nr:septum formation protein Maf [Bacillota bacterium]